MAATLTGIYSASAVNPPNAPASITAQSTSRTDAATNEGIVTVTWQKPADNGNPFPIAYVVTLTTDTTVLEQTIPTGGPSVSNYSAVFENLTGGTEYKVVVTSRSGDGLRTSASPTPDKIIPLTAPGLIPAASLKSTGKPGVVELSWSPPTSNGGSAITGYVIKTKAGAETPISDPAATSYTFSGLSYGSKEYLIRTVNANGKSAWIAFPAAIVPNVPGVPTGVVAQANTSSITVTWAAPASDGNSPITGYKVYLYSSVVGLIDTPTAASTTSAEILNLDPATYSVRVLATNLVGPGDLSETSTAVTIDPPSAKTDNTPVFDPPTLPNLQIGGTQTISATAPSTGVVTLTVSPSSVCTLSNGVITAVAEGTCSVRATTPSNTTYDVGIATKTFTVTKTLQTITFNSINNQQMPGPLVVSATTTASGLSVTFTASGNCTASGSTILSLIHI